MTDSEARRRAAEAMRRTPRGRFLPPRQVPLADLDGPVPIGSGQTNSQPRTVLDMLELLDVQPGQWVLDIGSGSGWTTAILARLVGPDGLVLGVERIPELAAFGARALNATEQTWAQIRVATPGTLGLPDVAPFDRILVSAEADELPDQLVEQVGIGGVMVLPVQGRMLRVTRDEDGVRQEEHGWYRFVPLVLDEPGAS
nr:protein-L-isoaspartate carboxylmethyltransferase [Luteipulveratus mongoliensis]